MLGRLGGGALLRLSFRSDGGGLIELLGPLYLSLVVLRGFSRRGWDIGRGSRIEVLGSGQLCRFILKLENRTSIRSDTYLPATTSVAVSPLNHRALVGSDPCFSWSSMNQEAISRSGSTFYIHVSQSMRHLTRHSHLHPSSHTLITEFKHMEPMTNFPQPRYKSKSQPRNPNGRTEWSQQCEGRS
jgi:hypothetical protein